LQQLSPESPGAKAQIAVYCLFCDDLAQAAHWFEQALNSRDAYAPIALQLLIAKKLRASAHWPKLAQLMNLPGTMSLSSQT
jgi:hypothetical protein